MKIAFVKKEAFKLFHAVRENRSTRRGVVPHAACADASGLLIALIDSSRPILSRMLLDLFRNGCLSGSRRRL